MDQEQKQVIFHYYFAIIKPITKLVIVGKRLEEIIHIIELEDNINLQWGGGRERYLKSPQEDKRCWQTLYIIHMQNLVKKAQIFKLKHQNTSIKHPLFYGPFLSQNRREAGAGSGVVGKKRERQRFIELEQKKENRCF